MTVSSIWERPDSPTCAFSLLAKAAEPAQSCYLNKRSQREKVSLLKENRISKTQTTQSKGSTGSPKCLKCQKHQRKADFNSLELKLQGNTLTFAFNSS